MSNNSDDVLLSLPSELVFCILSEWVGLKELSGLDVAFCNREKRNTLLIIFSSKEFVLGEEARIVETNYISWVTKRQIRQSQFYVNGHMLDYLEYVKVFGTNVKRVTFVQPHKEESGSGAITSALSHCKCLESLQISGMLASETPLEAIWRCSSLRELRVEFFVDFDVEPVYQLTVDCVPLLKLHTLIIEGCMMYALELLEMTTPDTLQSFQVSLAEDIDGEDLCAQLSKGYDLKALCVGGWLGGGKLIRLLALCPNLRHLDVDCGMDEELMPTQLAVQLSVIQLDVLRLVACSYANALLTELAVRGCSTLRVLFLDDCLSQGDTINNIASVCKGLTEFRVWFIGSNVFAAIDLQQLRDLTHLMVGLRNDLHVKTVLDRVVINCTKLTYLAISMHASDPCDFSSLHDPNVLPALSIFNVCHGGECDTSVLQMHRPKLRIGQAYDPHWHSFEDIVCNEGYSVW